MSKAAPLLRAAVFAAHLAAHLAALAVPALGHARVVWKGDFETGDLSQWSSSQQVGPDRLHVVQDPVKQGRFAARVTVRQGDAPIRASGNRNELVQMTDEKAGDEYYYRWSTMFAPGFPSVDAWQVFAQWHHSGCCGSPPLELYVSGETMHLRAGGTGGQVLWSAPLRRGVWIDFVLHARWSPDPRVGLVELTVDGKKELPARAIANMYPGETNYLKLGLYRDSSIAPQGVVFHDGMIIGTTLDDVVPAVAEAPRPPAEPPPPPASPPPAPAERPQAPEPQPTTGAPPSPPASPGPGQPPTPSSPSTPPIVPPGTQWPPVPRGPEVGSAGCSTALPLVQGGLGLLALPALWRRRRRRVADLGGLVRDDRG